MIVPSPLLLPGKFPSLLRAMGSGVPSPPADPLAPYYGVAPGQVNFDLPLHDPARMTMDASNYVSAVQHSGGAGAYFNATSSGSNRPQWIDGALRFSGNQFLFLANAADMLDMHLIAAVRADATASNKYRSIAGGSVGSAPFFYCGVDATNQTLEPRLYTQSTNNLISSPVVSVADATAWHIMECRWTDGNIHLYLDGVLLVSAAPNFSAGFQIPRIGGETSYATFPAWSGEIGRVVGVNKAGTATNLEPAVLAARQWLAQHYGVTLA